MKINHFRLRQTSLASRVTALIGFSFVVCVLSLGLVIQHSIDQHFAEQDAEEYEVMGAAVIDVLNQISGPMNGEEFQSKMSGAVSGHHGVFFGLFDPIGNAIYIMEGPNLGTIATSVRPVDSIESDNLHQWSEGDEVYRGVVLSVPADVDGDQVEHRLVLASDLSFHMHFWRSSRLCCGNISSWPR